MSNITTIFPTYGVVATREGGSPADVISGLNSTSNTGNILGAPMAGGVHVMKGI